MWADTPISPSVALVPMTAQGVSPPPAAPSMELTPPVSRSLPVSAQARPLHRPVALTSNAVRKWFMGFPIEIVVNTPPQGKCCDLLQVRSPRPTGFNGFQFFSATLPHCFSGARVKYQKIIIACGLAASSWAALALQITSLSPQGEIAQVRQVVAKFDENAVNFGHHQGRSPAHPE